MIPVTIRAELAPDDQAEEITITVTQGPVQLRHAVVPAHDAAVQFELDVGDYVAHSFVLGAARGEAALSFAVPQQTELSLLVP